MTNDAVRAVVITGKYAVQASPREKRNTSPPLLSDNYTLRRMCLYICFALDYILVINLHEYHNELALISLDIHNT